MTDVAEVHDLLPVATVGDGLGNVFVDVAGTWLTAARAHHQTSPTAGSA